MAKKTKRTAASLTAAVPVVRPSSRYATLSFVFGLLSWVPLLNLATVPLGVIFGAMGIWLAVKKPQEYAGVSLAIIGLVLSGVWLLMTVYAMVLYGPAALLQR